MARLAWTALLVTLVGCGARSVDTSDAGTPSNDDGGTTLDGGDTEHDAGQRPDAGRVGGIYGGKAGPGTTLANCQIYPNDNAWNVAIDGPDVQVIHTYDSHLAMSTTLHPDFGDWSNDGYGIPYAVVDGGQPNESITFSLYASESDPGPGGWVGANPNNTGAHTGVTAWPFFAAMHIEGNPAAGGSPGSLPGDQHGLVLQQGANGCVAWEAWNCVASGPPFNCANGAKFDLSTNATRPAGWTSGDAAGLSILAGLVRFDDVQAGAITHAIRVTFAETQRGYIPPATHAPSGAGALGSAYPPMGLRLRLKAGVNISSYSTPSKVVMTAMKRYGLLVADIGSNWYFQGDSDDRWTAARPNSGDSVMDQLVSDFRQLKGSDFEAIDSGRPVDTGL